MVRKDYSTKITMASKHEQWDITKTVSFPTQKIMYRCGSEFSRKIEAAFKQNKYVSVIYLDIEISLINSFLSDRVVSLKLGMKTVSKHVLSSRGFSVTFLWNVDMDDSLTFNRHLIFQHFTSQFHMIY